MRKWLGALSLVLAALMTWGCQNDLPPTTPTIIISNTNSNIQTGGSGASPVPSGPTGTCVAAHLGCDNMTGPDGQALPGCGAALADYEAPSGSSGRLDASPIGADGNKLDGFAVSGWGAVGACTLEGETVGGSGFNPTIHMSLGECIVSVGISGCPPAQRKFVGE